MSLYRNILKQSWQIAWHNKYLWFFGIFAALLGNGGEYEIIVRGLGGDGQSVFPSWQKLAETGVFSRQTLHNITTMMSNDALSLLLTLAVLLVILVLLIFLVWLTVVSQVALVNNTAGIIKQKNTNLRQGINSGINNFWPVFGLNILSKIIISLIFAVISLPLVLTVLKTNAAVSISLYIVGFIIFVPLAIALSFIIKYAIAYVVIRGSGLVDSLKQGWQLFMDNWLISFEMALILFFINFAVGLIIVLCILTLAVPFLFLGFIFYYLASLAGFWLIAIVALLSFLLLIVLGGAMLAVFQISSWTGLFLELIKGGGTPKIMRVLDNIVRK